MLNKDGVNQDLRGLDELVCDSAILKNERNNNFAYDQYIQKKNALICTLLMVT